MPVEAVTFDFWDTIVHATPPPFKEARIAALVDTLADHGRPVDVGVLDSLLSAVFTEEFTPAWQRNEQYTAVEAGRALARRLGQGAGGPLGDVATAAVVDAFVAAGDGVPTRLTPGVAEAVTDLVSAGVKVGIICDVGLTPSVALRRVLEAHGLLERFVWWSFSDEVGCYKPDPRIFAHALEGLGGVDPTRAAHIGDLRRTDIAGARAAGLTAIRYTGAADDRSEGPEGHHVIDDHAALVELLVG